MVHFKSALILICSLTMSASACSDEEALNITTFQNDCQNVTLTCTINPSCCNGVQFIVNNVAKYIEDPTQHHLVVDYLQDATNVSCRCRKPDRSYHTALNALVIPTPCPTSIPTSESSTISTLISPSPTISSSISSTTFSSPSPTVETTNLPTMPTPSPISGAASVAWVSLSLYSGLSFIVLVMSL